MTTDITSLAIQASLKKMVDQGHFSICTIDNICQLTGAIPDREAYQQLRLIHCVDFKAMPRALLDRVPDLISACINGPKLNISICLQGRAEPVTIEPEAPRRRLFGLLSR